MLKNNMPKDVGSLEDYKLVLKIDSVEQIDYLVGILENLRDDVVAENREIEESGF